MLDLLALQFHGCRPVSDNADRFLETDALQGSLSWYCVTDILGCLPRFLFQQTNKQRVFQRSSYTHMSHLNLPVCIAASQYTVSLYPFLPLGGAKFHAAAS